MSMAGDMVDGISGRRDLGDGEKLEFRELTGRSVGEPELVEGILLRRRGFRDLTRVQRLITLLLGFCAMLSTSLVLFRHCSPLPHKTASSISASTLHGHRARDALPQDSPAASSSSTASAAAAATSTATGVLSVFQVNAPVLGPDGVIDVGSNASLASADMGAAAAVGGNETCTVTLMEFDFADSFGKPFVGNYTPPACMGNSNSVVMNFSVTSKGQQFDRLAVMYFGDTELFRTSTAEPRTNGISWTYTKDMSHYMSLWKSSQKVIFDLPNQTTANLTGTYNTTLTATFFTANKAVSPADMIIPVSARMGINASMPSVFTLPAANASNTITNFPRNANRAVFSVSSTGQANEEFWWSNVLSSDDAAFNATAGTLFGFSPFREVQMYIDGQMAGVQWPFPVIFTGGVSPTFWSPNVGIDAFDLKEAEIDITPWLPSLCDGNAHTFSMNVVGLNDNGDNNASLSESVGSSWLVTGKIFIWTDSNNNSITTGSQPSISASPPSISVSQAVTKNSTGANDTLIYTTNVARTLTISSTITTQNDSNIAVSWTQTLSHADNGTFLSSGLTQTNVITTTGKDVALRGDETSFQNQYSYPMFANTTAALLPNGSSTFSAAVSRTKVVDVTGFGSIYPSGLQVFADLPESQQLVQTLAGTTSTTTQNGTSFLFQDPTNGKNSFSFGSTQQMMRFGGKSAQGQLGMEPDNELYFRSVTSSNGTVRSDQQRLVGKAVASNSAVQASVSQNVVVNMGVGMGRMAMARMGMTSG